MQAADLYLDFNLEQNKFTLPFLQKYGGFLRWFPEEVVLDVGCGPGDVTRHILYPWLPGDAKKSVLGVDISPIMKDIAMREFAHPDISFETFDIASRDLSVILKDNRFKGGFTKVFSFFVLHWINDLESVFRNVHKLLRPQGQVLLTFPVSRQFQRLYQQMQEREPWSTILKGVSRDIPDYFSNGDPEGEFLSLVTEAGFKVASCECMVEHHEYDSLDDFKKLIGSLDVHFKKIPTNLQAQYLDECVDILRQSSLKVREDASVVLSETQISALLEK